MFNTQRTQQILAILMQLKKGQVPKDVLKKYSGWGGLRQAIYNPPTYRELKKVLTDEEIKSLKQTLKNAYYTPKEIVTFMVDWLNIHGFKGGAVLEPSVGNDVFIEHMPEVMKGQCVITAVELDKLTSQITQQLYPDIQLINCAFEQYQPQEQFDLIIGNPPYGATTVKDQQHADISDVCIHHYFVAKSMRLLKQDGLLAMVLPSYFLDNQRKHVRHIIQREGGALLAAYRLPDDCFTDAKVTVDVVFLTKGKTNNAWLTTRDVTVNGLSQPMNDYFYQHSDHILGNLEIVDIYSRKGLTCKRRGDINVLMDKQLQRYRDQQLLAKVKHLLT